MNWRWHLARHIEATGALPHGRYVPDPDVTAGWIPAERLLEPEYLRNAIARARPAEPQNRKDDDPRIGVSRMSRQYCAALTCIAVTGLANGAGIDLSPANCTFVFRATCRRESR
jgi:hypothetical protein